MQITKLEHSGIIIEKNGKRLVFDPVEFAATLPKLENVVAIIITHLHNDHLQPEQINAILDLNPTAKIFAPADAAAELPQAIVVQGGEDAKVDNFSLRFFGKNHASITAGKVPCENLGVVVDDQVINPGDSFDLLKIGQPTSALLVPEAAPWTKFSETAEYIKIAKPQLVIPIHDGILSEMGKTIYNRILSSVCKQIGAKFVPLSIGESINL